VGDFTFHWAFRSAKVRPKSRLQLKSEVISLSEKLNKNYGLNTDLDPSLAELTWLQSVEFAWKRYSPVDIGLKVELIGVKLENILYEAEFIPD